MSPPSPADALLAVRGADVNGAPRRDLPRLLTPEDLAHLPQPSYLLEDMVPAHALCVVFAPSGAGKTFLQLDWSLSIATGTPWLGRDTTRGAVLVIAAEGVFGLHRRIEAWRTERRRDVGNDIRFVGHAVNFLDSDAVEDLGDAVEQSGLAPELFVVDTMARCMVGGEENSARDVGLFVDAIDALRERFASSALVVHHTGKSGETERGSSALRGAADVMHVIKPDGASLRLECEKAKDAEPYEPLTLHLVPVADSCVIRNGTNPGRLAPGGCPVARRTS